MKKTATQQTEEKYKYKFKRTEYECKKCGHIMSTESDTSGTTDFTCGKCGGKEFKKIKEDD